MAREIESSTPTPIDTDQQGTDGMPLACKKYRLTWWVLGAVLALLVVLGWVFIIIMLILEEKWQLVLVAWLLLYSAAHFCYWYFKRCRLRPSTKVLQLKVNGKGADCPPAYDDIINTEAPPPAYCTVVSETTKPPPFPASSMSVPTIVETSAEMSKCEGSDAPPSYVNSVSGAVAAGGLMPSPPAYQTPRHLRKISPRVLPAIHSLRAPKDSAVTATAAATVALTAAAALTQIAAAAGGVAVTEEEEEESMVEDPIRGPIFRHLRSTAIATLDVSTEGVTTPAVAAVAPEFIEDLQAPASFP